MSLLIKSTLTITGEIDDYEGHADEIEDVVEAGLIAAKNYIVSELGKLGIGPLVVSVEI